MVCQQAKAGAFAYANRRKQAGSLCYIAFWLAMLLSERETLERVLESVQSPAVEDMPIWECRDRILAHDVIASVALPRFDNSTMDGYAVRAEDAVRGKAPFQRGDRLPDLERIGLLIGCEIVNDCLRLKFAARSTSASAMMRQPRALPEIFFAITQLHSRRTYNPVASPDVSPQVTNRRRA